MLWQPLFDIASGRYGLAAFVVLGLLPQIAGDAVLFLASRAAIDALFRGGRKSAESEVGKEAGQRTRLDPPRQINPQTDPLSAQESFGTRYQTRIAGLTKVCLGLDGQLGALRRRCG